MVKNAAATGLLEKALKSLDGTNVVIHERISQSATSVDGLTRSANNADGSINQLTGRLRVLGEVAAVLSPALAPAGGVLIAGVGGLANQMGFAAVAGGVLIGSLQGVGDALGAMNKAQLDPTNKNLQDAKEALERLSPAARDFAKEAFALKPALVALRDIGAEALLPGLTESLDNLERLGPQVGGIMEAIGGALGDIASDASASLASERWADFFSFIETEGPKILSELASTVGDLTHGLSELWMAFEPLNSDFSSWLMDVANGFDQWATGLSATEGFAEFVSYIRETGPQVADTLSALGDAVVQIVQATAPLGGPVLAAIEGFANAIAAIADSDLGTPVFAGVAALALLNRTLAVTAALSKTTGGGGLFAGLGTASGGLKKQAGSIRSDVAAMSDSLVAFGSNADKAGAAADRMKKRLATGAGLAGIGVLATGAADSLGLTNTASLALMGAWGGAPGIAIGAGAGLLLDMAAAGDGATAAIDGLAATAQSGNLEALQAQLEAAKNEFQDLTETDWSSGGDIFGDAMAGFSNGLDGVDKSAEKIKAAEKAVKELTAAEEARVAASRRSALTYASEIGLNADLSMWRSRSVEDIKAQADALAEVRKAANDSAQSFLGFGDSLNDADVSLSEFIKGMQESADALRNFNANSLRAAKRGLDDGLIMSLRAAGEEGALRMKQFANATQAEIGRANKAHRSQTAAMEETARVAERLAGMSPVVRVKAETAAAMNDINGLEARLRAIKDESVNVVVRTINTGDTQLGPRNQAADGATVPKTGKPYADRHLYLLADGEEVISNRFGQADRHRSLLKSINAGRRLANGGTAGEDDVKDGKDKRRPRNYFDITDNTKALQRAIDRLTERSEDQTAAVEAQRYALEQATEATEMWSDRMADVAKGTVSGFNTGLFERDANVWAAGSGGGPISNLTGDIAGLNERAGLQAQLAGMGLSGEALAALLSEGDNADIQALIASGQVGQYADLFNQRAALQGSVGAAAGQQAFGQEYAAARAYEQKQFAVLQSQLASSARLEAQIGSLVAAQARTEAQIAALNKTGPERSGYVLGKVINENVTSAWRESRGRR